MDPSVCVPVPVQPAFHDKPAGLRAGRGDLEPGAPRQLGELGERAGLPACYQHVDGQVARSLVGRDAAEDHHPSVRAGSLGAPAEDGHGRLVGPVVEHALQQVHIGSGRPAAWVVRDLDGWAYADWPTPTGPAWPPGTVTPVFAHARRGIPWVNRIDGPTRRL
jgi:hypothetical protein